MHTCMPLTYTPIRKGAQIYLVELCTDREHTASTIFVIVSLFFCFCLSLPISSCVYLRLPSPLPLPFICSTGLLCLLCYLMYRIHIYVAWIFGLVTWPMSHGMWCGYESIDYFSLRICQSYILETESHNAHTYQRRIETEWQWQFQWEDEKSKQ